MVALAIAVTGKPGPYAALDDLVKAEGGLAKSDSDRFELQSPIFVRDGLAGSRWRT